MMETVELVAAYPNMMELFTKFLGQTEDEVSTSLLEIQDCKFKVFHIFEKPTFYSLSFSNPKLINCQWSYSTLHANGVVS